MNKSHTTLLISFDIERDGEIIKTHRFNMDIEPVMMEDDESVQLIDDNNSTVLSTLRFKFDQNKIYINENPLSLRKIDMAFLLWMALRAKNGKTITGQSSSPQSFLSIYRHLYGENSGYYERVEKALGQTVRFDSQYLHERVSRINNSIKSSIRASYSTLVIKRVGKHGDTQYRFNLEPQNILINDDVLSLLKID